MPKLRFVEDQEVVPYDGGDPVKISSFGGDEAALVVFGDYDCEYSREAVAQIPDLARRYIDQGIRIVYVHLGERGPEVDELYENIEPVELYAGPPAVGFGLGFRTVPRMFIFDGDGEVIVEMHYVDEHARKVLDHLLSHSPSEPPKPDGEGPC